MRFLKGIRAMRSSAAAATPGGMGWRDLIKTTRDAAAEGEALSRDAMDDYEANIAYAQLGNKLGQSGVEARGVVHSVRATGSHIGSIPLVELDVSIKPPDGEPYPTTIRQALTPDQMAQLTEGKAITVRYDPDSPTSALIYGW